MIRYALACSNGHDFESWFRDSEAFDMQAQRGLVSCPVCDSTSVTKQIMSPRVSRTDLPQLAEPEREDTAANVVPAPESTQPVVLMSDREKAFRQMLRAVRQHVVENSEHVGAQFANEARRMHEGVTEFRSIWGEATPEEARALAEEGIEAMALPILPEDRN